MRPHLSKALGNLLHNKIVITLSVIGSVYLLVCGTYLSFTATHDLHRADQAALALERQLNQMTQAVDLKSAAVHGWYSRELSNTQRLTNSISHLASELDQTSLDPTFRHTTLQWASESRRLLLHDLDQVKVFRIADPSSLDLQRAVIGVYETQIQLVDQMADLLRHWDADSLSERRGRLAAWHTIWKVFNQRHIAYVAANERQTAAIQLESEAFVQQSQAASTRFRTIPRRMTLSNVNALMGFTIVWILLGLRLAPSATLTKRLSSALKLRTNTANPRS